MNNDPYPSLSPVANWITGFSISCLVISVPFIALDLGKTKLEGSTSQSIKSQIELKCVPESGSEAHLDC